jgi:uncharacterized protein (TIGR03435 family)
MVQALAFVGLLVFASSEVWAQSAAAKPAFEVASVKRTQHGRTPDGWSFSDVKIASPGRLVAVNASLDECIRWAYRLKEYQISGPDWLKSDEACYDIEAKASSSGVPPEQIRLMLQTLLAEQFKLVIHQEARTVPTYSLVVAKRGARLHENPEGRAGFNSEGSRDGVRVNSEKASMGDLANRLSLDLDRPVLDRTEIKGWFRIALEWAREGDGPSIFSAIQQQLGLKLESAKAPIKIFVIDHAEKVPTEN